MRGKKKAYEEELASWNLSSIKKLRAMRLWETLYMQSENWCPLTFICENFYLRIWKSCFDIFGFFVEDSSNYSHQGKFSKRISVSNLHSSTSKTNFIIGFITFTFNNVNLLFWNWDSFIFYHKFMVSIIYMCLWH